MTSISQILIANVLASYRRSDGRKTGKKKLDQAKIARTRPIITKRTYGPYSVDHFLHSISWKWLTTEVLFHVPFKSVTHSSKVTVPTFAYKFALWLDPRDSLWPRPHVSDMCARIRVFLNPQLFPSGFKDFHVHTYPYSNGVWPSTRIRRKLAHRIPNAHG